MKDFKKKAQVIINIIVFSTIIIYVWYNRSDFTALLKIGKLYTVILFFLLLTFFIITSYTFKVTIELLHKRISLYDAFGISILSNFANYFAPMMPGLAVKAVLLKKHGLETSQFSAVMAANLFLSFLITGMFGALILICQFGIERFPKLLMLVCIGLIVLSIIPFFVRIPQIYANNRLKVFFRSALEGFSIARQRYSKILIINLTFVLQIIFSGFIYQSAFAALHIHISFVNALMIGVFTIIANIVMITPNNIGVQEIVSAYLLTLTGTDFQTGIIAASMIRIVHVLITFILTPWFSNITLFKGGT